MTVPGVECSGITAVATSLESFASCARGSTNFVRPKSSIFDLQRHFPIELCLLGQINLTHATRAEFGDDLIVG